MLFYYYKAGKKINRRDAKSQRKIKNHISFIFFSFSQKKINEFNSAVIKRLKCLINNKLK
tara:strand:+ start:922 stop:1101 length:180 start_codon:yes stop_codon:yes gene_type:complete